MFRKRQEGYTTLFTLQPAPLMPHAHDVIGGSQILEAIAAEDTIGCRRARVSAAEW